MKNKFILGLILTSVLLMSVIGVSAQITGEATSGTYNAVKTRPTGTGSGYQGIDTDGNADPTGTSSQKRSSGSPGKGWIKTLSVNNEDCWTKPASAGKATGRFLDGLFYRTYSGNIVITGEMTQETCDKMSSGKGTLGPSNMKCNWIADVVMQSGRLCTMYEGKQVCGRAGEQVHANDGTSFVFKKERRGLGAPAITINVEATESVRQLPKYS